MEKDQLVLLLQATQSSWKLFNLHTKVKILRHEVFYQLDATPAAKCFDVLIKTIHFQGLDFDFETSPFDIADPTFSGLMFDFLTEVHQVMKTANQLPGSDDPEDLKMGMADALGSEQVVDVGLQQELDKLQKRADET